MTTFSPERTRRLAERIQQRLEAVGKTARAASIASKGGPDVIRNIFRAAKEGKGYSPRADTLELLAGVLETTPAWLTDPDGAVVPPTATRRERPVSNVRLPDEDRPVRLGELSGPRDVPVLGITVGGNDGDFQFNGQTIDYAPRPPGLTHKKDVYALYISNDSMVPRFEHGDRIYVDPHRTPGIGEYVVIELKPERDEPGPSFVKRLVKRAGNRVVVEQFNPPKELEFDRDEIKAIHRVIPWNEVNGV